MSFQTRSQDLLYDGGGGASSQGLTLSASQDAQWRMFSRHVNQHSSFHAEYLRQEKRQLILREEPVHIVVNVLREDFPSIKAQIAVTYLPTAAQEVWHHFLSDISKALSVEFIYTIVDRVDKSPVFRILRLKNGHDYLVRQRESSSILEILQTGQHPIEHSWEVTQRISGAQRDLQYNSSVCSLVNDRIGKLTSLPMTQLNERTIANNILSSERPELIVQIMCSLYISTSEGQTLTKELSVRSSVVNYADLQPFAGKIDMVSLHRLAIEQINRLILSKNTLTRGIDLVIKQFIHYLFKMLSDLVAEVDLVVLGMKLFTDLVDHLSTYRDKVYQCILDCMQFHAPAAPAHRPRRPLRKMRGGGASVEYSFAPMDSSAGGNGVVTQSTNWMAPKLSKEHHPHVGPFGIDLSLDVNKFTRYGQYETLVYDRSMNRSSTNTLELFAKAIEVDENMQAITPRTKANRAKAKREAQLEEQKRKLEIEEIRRSQQQKEAIAPPSRNLIRARERVEHETMRLQHELAMESTQKLSDMLTMMPSGIAPSAMQSQHGTVSAGDTEFENSAAVSAEGKMVRPRTPGGGGIGGTQFPPVPTMSLRQRSQPLSLSFTNKQQEMSQQGSFAFTEGAQWDISALHESVAAVNASNVPARASIKQTAGSVDHVNDVNNDLTLPSLVKTSAMSKPKVKVKIKEKSTSSNVNEDSVNVIESKKRWKGSKGEIGQ